MLCEIQELIMEENFNLSPNCNIDTSVPNKISIRLRPQVALFRTETKVVLFLLIFFSWIIGGSFLLLGAWPVLIFLAVDILLIYYFLKRGSSNVADWEEIDIQSRELIVRKVRNSKCFKVFNIPTYWSRVELTGQRYGRSKLVVYFRDNYSEIASFLDWKSKVKLERYLNFELHKLRAK